jgi:hypothetical protein
MIESLMWCGIGLLGGCLLMLAFIPLIHARAVRLTKRDIVEATPLARDEIQADKDHLRAQFAMSVRRLELSIEEMRAKAAGHSSEVSRQGLEISRLQVELDKKKALILVMRAREHIRKNMIRRILKIVTFLFVRSSRQRQRELFEASLNRVTRRA